MLPTAATDFYALQQRVNFTAANEVRRAWRRMGDDFDASWRRVRPVALSVIAEAQSQATVAARDYVPRVLGEMAVPDLPEADFVPESLVGRASDGRRLDTLSYGAVVQAKTAVAEGASTQQALEAGGDWLDLMTKLQVADAARQAVGVLMASRKNVEGTVRVLNPPSCQRCAILAGRWYRWTQGFDRHPRCDCMNLPVRDLAWAERRGYIADPMDAYRRGEIKDLTQAQVKAIEDGANIGKVVNAYRGTSTTATKTRVRPVDKTKHSVEPGMPDLLGDILGAKASMGRTERARILTPEGIYKQAAGDRDEAIRLLREFGYLD